MTTISTSTQRQTIAALFNGKRIKGFTTKQQLVRLYTNGRTGTTTEMTQKEAQDLIEFLKRQGHSPSKSDTMRKKIIHFAHLMEWKLPDGRADMKRINEWCIKSGQFHKPLNSHTFEELPRLVSQFEQMLKSYLNSV